MKDPTIKFDILQEKPRIAFIGNHSHEHCGCAAVAEVIEQEIYRIGQLVDIREQHDILVVNGEGSMHHGSRNFLNKMHHIRLAQQKGVQTFLVNSVWQENPSHYDECLKGLDGIVLRGNASASDLLANHNIRARTAIDLSYYAKVDSNAKSTDFGNNIVTTDIYTPAISFAWPSHQLYQNWTRIDMREFSWSSLVNSLRTASVLVAGRHHAMYAACVARTLFVPFKSNTHKMEDLIHSAGVEIPIAEHVSEIPRLIEWAKRNRAKYIRLFDWMNERQPWQLKADEDLSHGETVNTNRRSLRVRAASASQRGDFKGAVDLWNELYRQGADITKTLHLTCETYLFSGEVPFGMELICQSRAKDRDKLWHMSMLLNVAKQHDLWRGERQKEDWWAALRSAADAAEFNDIDNYNKHVKAAVDQAREVGDEVFLSSVLFLLSCRLISLSMHSLAYELRDTYRSPTLPEWCWLQEEVLLLNLCRRFDDMTADVVEKAVENELWTHIPCRHSVYRFRYLRDGATNELAQDLLQEVRLRPDLVVFRRLLFSVAAEVGILEDLLRTELSFIDRRLLEEDAPKLLHLADAMAKQQILTGHYQIRQSNFLKGMNEETERFISVLSDPDQRVAVVGNSPIGVGSNLGSTIDSYDYVIRFNEFKTDPPFDADYGSKTTFAVRTNMNESALSADSYPDGAILVMRHGVFRGNNWEHLIGLYEGGMRIAYLPWEAYGLAAKRVGRTPSVGLVIAQFMAKMRGKVHREDFFGFSFVDQLAGERSAHYFNNEAPSMIHDWERERDVFDDLFK